MDYGGGHAAEKGAAPPQPPPAPPPLRRINTAHHQPQHRRASASTSASSSSSSSSSRISSHNLNPNPSTSSDSASPTRHDAHGAAPRASHAVGSSYCYGGGGGEAHSLNHRPRLQLDGNGVSGACRKDEIYIEKLERELRNCSQEIEYLQDQLNLRNVEANFIGEHVHSLELKLMELEKLNDEANSRCLVLMEELNRKAAELQNSALEIQKLETIVLDSQCEVESLKLDITAQEEKCFEADSFSGQQLAQEEARLALQLRQAELQLSEAQQVINSLEGENKQLKELLLERDAKTKRSFSTVEEKFDNLLKQYKETSASIGSKVDEAFLLEIKRGSEAFLLALNKELSLPHEMGNFEDFLGQFLSKLAVVTACDQHIKYEIEKMANQIQESEGLIKQLKEELREEKLKAKEEAEDLTQEMAELRYQITGMLEEEYKRRAFIEQASIKRIQELEAQVIKEQKKSIAALRRYQEAQQLATTRSLEIKKLRNALKRFHSATNSGTDERLESCPCGSCDESLCSMDNLVGSSTDSEALEKPLVQDLIQWYPDDNASII
ncbi:paramyosin [Ananas comosus]|uniref:Paramyosin n=1 Tax=Ananas comosus TaxID=4615 RepID=A0A6P5G708_ANACO|nr:paramyosin [Ananas comosus]